MYIYNMEKITTIENEVEAKLLTSLLDQENIPHVLISHHDSVYDGIFQTLHGWGHVEADIKYKEKIVAILSDLRK